MTPAPSSSTPTLRHFLLTTWLGRALVSALALRGLAWGVEIATGDGPLYALALTIARLALIAAFGWLAARLLILLRRHLLWRVRRRLMLSYVFVGVIPVILLVSFFASIGLVLWLQVGIYLFRRGVDDVVGSARLAARSVAAEMAANPQRMAVDALARVHTQYMSQFPTLSVAVVPWGEGATRIAATDDGYWVRDGAPRAVPEWISVGGFEGVLMTSDPQDDGHALMTARGVDVVNEGGRTFAVIADIAVDEAVLEQVKEATGVDCHLSSLHFSSSEAGRSPMAPSLLDGGDSARRRRSWRPSREWLRWPWNTSVAFVEWSTGRSGDASVEVTIDLLDVYNRVTASRHDSPGFSVRDVVPLGIAIVALLFLIVQSVALVMGVTLARSITGSIHELFDGTERVMQGDFSHRIRMTAQDQLGELAQSFNRMTASVESLLLQAAEKKRLEEELRIAREIQMSLLPSGPLDAPGISITALCVPAREVGGDYYDFFHLDSDRVGVLIADVAGKGTSAALYMAELKGLMLSLSQLHESPRRLLTEVNRIISAHLDGRSFITMTYAIVDTAAGTFTYARAGHTPLIHVTGGSDARVATAHAPEGLVLGIRIDGLSERFESMLEERTIPLQRDDVFVFYTDGVTEAMNPAMDLFGEERLCALIEAHGDLPTDELRERVVREIETFVGAADQHDDLTMILLKVERVLVAPTLAASAMPV